MTAALLVQSAVIGLSIGSIYILMALGLTLMFGMMHIINFAHGAVYMLGAFAIYYVYFQWGAPYFAAFVLAMLLLGAFGYLVERSIYRPIKGGVEPTLVALLALTTLLQAAGCDVTGLDTGLFASCTFVESPVEIPAQRMDVRDVALASTCSSTRPGSAPPCARSNRTRRPPLCKASTST